MKGLEVIFMAPRSRRHRGKPVLDSVAAIAKSHGIRRHTRRVDAEGAGASGHTHSAHFFELADEPEELMFVLEGDKAEELMRAVEAEALHVFCICRTIDYWEFGH
ncbi:DUF190 domain-containing protein [Salinisphaera hydrothermalis]|uniref:DUF190 domain-containing protein n=1 Tax=Salinisphaera hydrothermalis TaxID=563188 RepID=UPI0033416AEE